MAEGEILAFLLACFPSQQRRRVVRTSAPTWRVRKCLYLTAMASPRFMSHDSMSRRPTPPRAVISVASPAESLPGDDALPSVPRAQSSGRGPTPTRERSRGRARTPLRAEDSPRVVREDEVANTGPLNLNVVHRISAGGAGGMAPQPVAPVPPPTATGGPSIAGGGTVFSSDRGAEARPRKLGRRKARRCKCAQLSLTNSSLTHATRALAAHTYSLQ